DCGPTEASDISARVDGSGAHSKTRSRPSVPRFETEAFALSSGTINSVKCSLSRQSNALGAGSIFNDGKSCRTWERKGEGLRGAPFASCSAQVRNKRSRARVQAM